MWLLTAFHPVLKAAIALRQLLGDDVFTSRNIQISGALKEDDLADLESVIRHGRAPNAQDGYYDFDGKVRRRACTSCQISAMLNNASSRPQFSATRFFAFDSFGAPLVVGAFDAADEVGPAERDLRFFVMSATPPKTLKAF
jgi:hypothetical protein